MTLFEVISKNDTKVKRTVYAVRDNPKSGEVEFLVYGIPHFGWGWMPAKYYEPVKQPRGK